MAEISFGTTMKGSLDDVRPRVEAALKEQGFGVLTEIDVKTTLKAKLDQEFRPYVILGACNPRLAYRALSSAPEIGAMLPCNVILDQRRDGEVAVRVFDPEVGLGLVDDPELRAVGEEAKRLLKAAVAELDGAA